MSTRVALLTALAIVSAAGFGILIGDQEVVNWHSEFLTDTPPDSIVGFVVRVEFDVPAPIGGSLLPEARWPLLIPSDATGGRIFIAPHYANGDTGSFGREVDLMTGEPLETMHYGEQPGQWFAGREDNP